jgi:hypothetical protein
VLQSRARTCWRYLLLSGDSVDEVKQAGSLSSPQSRSSTNVGAPLINGACTFGNQAERPAVHAFVKHHRPPVPWQPFKSSIHDIQPLHPSGTVPWNYSGCSFCLFLCSYLDSTCHTRGQIQLSERPFISHVSHHWVGTVLVIMFPDCNA